MLVQSPLFLILLALSGVRAFANPATATAFRPNKNGPHFSTMAGQPALAGDLKPPAALYEGAVAVGAAKALAPASKIFKLAVVAGAHIGFGACT
jgi:hypothetical protein